MKKTSIVLGVLIVLAFSFGSIAVQNGYDLFQKALAKERAEGNLEEAIALYQKVIEESKDKSLAAKAQLRIGICYEKLGQEKAKLAQEAFQKVVDNYPGQLEIVRLAREKLTQFLQAKSVEEKENNEFTLRKIGIGPEWGQGEISPDGRYVSYIDWDSGNLAVQDLTTGKKHYITHEGSWEKSTAQANNSRWSPDGKYIAYDWWDWNNETYFVGIRIASPDGSKTRTIFQVPAEHDEVCITFGWSPDGKSILAGIQKSSTLYQFALISVNDGSVNFLESFDVKNKWLNADFSPDGNYIVFERRQEDGSVNSDLHLLSIKNRKESPLITHPAHDRLLGCASDGKSVLFASDRRGTQDLWLIQLESGKIKRSPRLIKESLGNIEPLGFTTNGSFYYVSSKSKTDVYVASLDPAEENLIEIPEQPIQYIGRASHSPAYSPDGKYLAFIADRGGHPKSRFVICVRDLDTNEDKEFYPGHVNVMDLRWSADGRFLFARASDRPVSDFGSPFFNYMICRVDTHTGDIQTVIESDPDENGKIGRLIYSFDCSKDGKSLIYLIENDKEEKYEIIARNLQTEEEETLCRVGPLEEIYVTSISPSGKWLAFTGSTRPFPGAGLNEGLRRHIKILPVEGGEPRELLNYKPDRGYIPWCAWTNDGKQVLFSKAKPGGNGELWGVPISDDPPQTLGSLDGYRQMKPGHMRHLTLHPREPHIAFDSSPSQDPEMWMMRNFLTADEKGRKGGQK